MSFLDLTEEMPPHPQMRVGRYTYGLKRESSDVTMSCNWRLEIGSFCSIAPGVRFVFGRHQMNCPTTFPIREFVRHEWKPELWPEETIVVGHDVWIATNALPFATYGVRYGNGVQYQNGGGTFHDFSLAESISELGRLTLELSGLPALRAEDCMGRDYRRK